MLTGISGSKHVSRASMTFDSRICFSTEFMYPLPTSFRRDWSRRVLQCRAQRVPHQRRAFHASWKPAQSRKHGELAQTDSIGGSCRKIAKSRDEFLDLL